jgi:hypothetical protein
MFSGSVDGAENHPDVVNMLRLMPICINLHKLPNEVAKEDMWTIDFLNLFFMAQQKKIEYEKSKMRP